MELIINIDDNVMNLNLEGVEEASIQGMPGNEEPEQDKLPSWEKLFVETMGLESAVDNAILEHDWLDVAFALGSLVALSSIKDLNLYGLAEPHIQHLHEPKGAYKEHVCHDSLKAIHATLKGFLGVKALNKTKSESVPKGWDELEVVYNKANED